MAIRFGRTILAAGAFVILAASSALAADENAAVGQIKGFYSVLTETMKQGPALGPQGRFEKLAPTIDKTFNLAAMTQFAVGPSWAQTSAADQKSLIDAFRRYTIANYASNFKRDSGVKFVVKPDVTAAGQDEIIQSELQTPKEAPVALNYRMRQSSGMWKVLDVYSAGFVSELALRRSDFSSVIAKGGASALIKKLNELADRMLKGA